MNLKHLEYFYTLAKTQHFAKAAQICHVTQPTLSAGIAKLEQALNAELVVRNRQFVALTEQGELVLQHAQNILFEQQTLIQQISQMQSGLSGQLKLGIVPQSNIDIMPLLKRFYQAYPKITINLAVMTNQQIIDELLEHNIDIGLGFADNELLKHHSFLNIYPQGCNNLAVLHKEELAFDSQQNGSISLSQTATLALCLLNKNMQFRQSIDQVFINQGLVINPVFETDSLFHLINAVKQGLGNAIVTSETARVAAQLFDLQLSEISSDKMDETVFICRKHHLSVIAKAFLDHL
ncbi:LysR family transcriptional regulator [Catenovulum sp. 2E275]|uniref:LysR family transcriptional regulator n=1 Tax=Catenovulum sp. 2E275 TaxID=2980497 RepID=UPI0021D22ADA|nr:LysR family transcriptional regulator [Catenovulum sp. 2E275]MCU4675991.1 LysR family transcriptional regulator [Catenovulum sp. 2E275]